MSLTAMLSRLQMRLRGMDALGALTAACVALAGSTAAGAWLWQSPQAGAAGGAVAGVLIVAAGWHRAWHAWTLPAVARVLEARVAGLDNLVITAVELGTSPGRASERMRLEVLRHAQDRASVIAPGDVVPLWRPVLLLGAALAGAATIVAVGVRTWDDSGPPPAHAPIASGITGLRVVVTPPAYLRTGSASYDDPERLSIPAGSRLRLHVDATTALAWFHDARSGSQPLARGADGTFSAEWIPEQTATLVVAAGDSTAVASSTRLLPIVVEPDRPPSVRIETPGRDLAFRAAPGAVEIRVEAEDAEALQALELRFTRLSGSGEAFSFVEGRVPLDVERVSEQRWTARAVWPLAPLALEDGDAVVYRAVAKDTNPGSDWASSESYTIEVGARLEAASAGFALPDEDRRYAISQQMVIVKTERLQADRNSLDAGDWAEQTRLLAMEQRMVRAEVVFLSGGEIEDEVEEAAHAHELQEGRLENRGRAEMLRAITEMSRAEARLIAGDAAGALAFERAALEALQRAFDRRRYFLRTLPERARIDAGRRLSGERKDASSFVRPRVPPGDDPLAAERGLMTGLSAIAESGEPASAGLVATFASLDTQSAEWLASASALASADSAAARRAAALEAMNLVAARARAVLAPPAGPPGQPAGALRGWWAAESRQEKPR